HRRFAPPARLWHGASRRGDRHRARAWGAPHLPRGPAEQRRRAGALRALRLPGDRRAPRLLPRPWRARGRARPQPGSRMSRRSRILAEMGLTPIWRLRNAVSPPEESPERPVPSGWVELKQAVSTCTACDLHKSRTQTVFGVGDEKAEWMLVGEAPGAEED